MIVLAPGSDLEADVLKMFGEQRAIQVKLQHDEDKPACILLSKIAGKTPQKHQRNTARCFFKVRLRKSSRKSMTEASSAQRT